MRLHAGRLQEGEDSGDGREEQFKSRMSRMIEKLKEVIARARDPDLNLDERRKASHDVVLNMMGHPTFHDIDIALAEANKMRTQGCRRIARALDRRHGERNRSVPTSGQDALQAGEARWCRWPWRVRRLCE